MQKQAKSANSEEHTRSLLPPGISQIDHLNVTFSTFLQEFKLTSKKDIMTRSFVDYVNDSLFMVKVIKTGIPYSVFAAIQSISLLTDQQWADILNVSGKSLQRYKGQNQLFKPIQSEKILELGEIFILGQEVFGDAAKFKLWLETPSFALGGVVPSTLLSDSYGQDLLVDELTRIQHGIFA